MITSFLFSAFGFMFVHRILSWLQKYKFISDKLKQKLSVILFIFVFCLFFFSKNSPSQIWLAFLLIFFCIIMIPVYVEFQRRNCFNKTLISNIDLILLQMISGKSFRESLLIFLGQKDSSNHIFSEICAQIYSNQVRGLITTSKNATRIFEEFIKIDQSTHKRIEKLKSLRHSIKIDEKFRQKSRTAQMQARAQSLVLSVLYLLALIYFFINYNFKSNFQLLLLSIALFLLGTIWIWKLGRSLKWKA